MSTPVSAPVITTIPLTMSTPPPPTQANTHHAHHPSTGAGATAMSSVSGGSGNTPPTNGHSGTGALPPPIIQQQPTQPHQQSNVSNSVPVMDAGHSHGHTHSHSHPLATHVNGHDVHEEKMPSSSFSALPPVPPHRPKRSVDVTSSTSELPQVNGPALNALLDGISEESDDSDLSTDEELEQHAHRKPSDRAYPAHQRQSSHSSSRYGTNSYSSYNSYNQRRFSPNERERALTRVWSERERDRYYSDAMPPYPSNSSPMAYLSATGPGANSLSEPIEAYGPRCFALTFTLVNGFFFLIRDASLKSFVLYLIVINTCMALVILSGKPFAFALLVRANNGGGRKSEAVNPLLQPAYSSLLTVPASSQPQSMQSVNRTLNPTKPSVSASAAQSMPSPLAAKLATPATPSAIGAQRQLSPTAVAALAPAAAAITAGPAATTAAVAITATPATDAAPLASSQSLETADSIVVADIASTPSSPLSTFVPPSSIVFDSGPWTPLPLPLYTRGFRHRIPAGSTLHFSDVAELGTWCKIAGETFSVRTGPNYKRNKTKAPSLASMYDCIAVDIFQTDSKIDHIARMIELPLPADRMQKREAQPRNDRRKQVSEILANAANNYRQHTQSHSAAESQSLIDASVQSLLSELPDGDFDLNYDYIPSEDDTLCGVPPLWIVNFQIPGYDPPMFYTKEDGEGFSVVLYFAMTEATRQELIQSSTAAARLLRKFVDGVGDEKMHSRYKSIPRVTNAEDANVGSAVRGLLRKYNAKPFLTGPWCHSFVKGPGYIEADIDVHRFRTIPRKGVYQFLDSLKSMVIDVAFVVEGHDDEELPEQIQGACKLHFPAPSEAKNVSQVLQQANQ